MATTTTPTPKRVLVSELQKKVATLKVNDWDLTFNYESEAGKAVTNLTVSGVKGNTAYMNYAVNGQQINISFTNTPCDADLLAAINVEVDDIRKPIVTP